MADIIIPDCLVCGKQLDQRKYIRSCKRRKTCSKECSLKLRTIIAKERCTKKCEHCGKEFKAKSATKTRFCSKDCSTSANKAKPRACLFCGSTFSPIRWQKTKNRFISDRANNRDYCTPECRSNHIKSGREKTCLSCKVRFTPIRTDKSGKYFPYDLPTTCSKECHADAYPMTQEIREAISLKMAGDKHPNWQGGSHRQGFRCHGWNRLAEKVRNRAGRVCEHCGKTEEENGRRLDVNHKVPFHQFKNKTQANKLSNLEALCRSCHTKTDWEWRKENEVQMVIPFFKREYRAHG